ncbi:hypothetical protein BVG16_13315 [Paenibacillus selenitireducens]|uniref:Uncharacterized protein n=1 Tax=Paenibacillus selenitireducens TaxID=1324314 RepID=A0A1T2XCD2_9BACL|nr:hypothetical protein [Paenibacillus selenitireducens]OPA77432.1 hypothetical protein BVG16_13315 [Paenibacillus selenitireducens]
MRNHNDEKAALEAAAIGIFLNIYNLNHPQPLSIWKRQERPDYVLTDGRHHRIGVEVTHLFYDHLEARRVLGRLNPNNHGEESFEEFAQVLNDLLQQKEKKFKKYNQSYPVSLLVRNVSPLFGMSDVLKHKDLYYKPSGMMNVWFLSKDGIDEWLLKDLFDL